MSLSDVMSHAGLAGYAEAAMIVFMIAFVAIVVRLFLPGRRRELEEAKRLPFDDGPHSTERPGARP